MAATLGPQLTKVVADALVAQQRGMLEGVAAVQDARVGAQRRDAAQRQHRVVEQQRAGPLPETQQHRAVAAVLRVAEDQRLPAVLFLTCTNAHNSMREYERHPLPKNNQHQIEKTE